MADKEFLLGNKARDLLLFTKRETKVASGDVNGRDMRAIFHNISQLDDVRDIQKVCRESVRLIDQSAREDFTKSNFRMYGEDMREIAKAILRDIHSANNKKFDTECRDRIAKIDDAIDGCSLLIEYIQLCLDDGVIGTKKAGVWTRKVADVKYMAAAWRKTCKAKLKEQKDREKKEASLYLMDMIRSCLPAIVVQDEETI